MEDIALFGIEEVNSAAEGNLIEPLQVKKGAVVREGPILPEGCDFLDVILRPVLLLIGEDEVRYNIVAAVLASPLGRSLEETVLHLGSQGLVDDALDDLGSLDAGQLCFLEPGSLLGHA